MSYPVQSNEQGDASALMEKIQGLMSQGGEGNFAPFLPLFLRLKGKPYGLDDHFPFEPFFDLDVPPETVLKTGRQCGKSNALAAKGLLICATVPHFSVLYITPLFEQIRRFSTQYLRPFIETSPLRSAWVGPDTENSVLQRSFCNFSRIFCSYAFTDAERIRGIPSELIGIDESARGDTTWVMTSRGRLLIRDVVVGDQVESFDPDGRIVYRRVVESSWHGRRRCYRLHTSQGTYVDLTSDSFVATSAGWLRVSQIVEAASRRAQDETGRDRDRQEEAVGHGAEGPASGDAAGRRVHQPGRLLRHQPQPQAGRVPLDQVHLLVRARSWRTIALEEEQTRAQVGQVLDCRHLGAQILARAVLPRGREDGHGGVAEGHRRDQPAPGPGVVGGRRRLPHEARLHAGPPDLHERFHVFDVRGQGQGKDLPPGDVQNVLRRSTDAHPGGLHASVDVLQAGHVWQSGDGRLPLLRQELPVKGPPGGVEEKDPLLVLRQRLLSDRQTSPLVRERKGPSSSQGTAGGRASEEKGEARRSRSSQGETGGVEQEEPREAQGLPGHLPGQEDRLAARDRVVLPGLQAEAGGHAGAAELSADDAQERQPFRGEESDLLGRVHPADGLAVADLVRIEDVGVHDVFDIEVEGTHTFVANGIGVSNCQNFDPGLLAVVNETISASTWRAKIYSGTPKTLDTTLHWAWTSSSQAEWCIPCLVCHKINVPAAGYDLERMIGPVRDDISEESPGIICANSKCGRPVNPRLGRWVHKVERLAKRFPGYHVPQIILPIHYAREAHWASLVAKMNGYGNTTTAKFYNECLGESYDQGTKLVNITDLVRAGCLEWENSSEPSPVVLRHARNYDLLILTVDWGGGGEDRVSFTTLAVMGIKPSGQIDVIYGKRLLTPHDHLREAEAVLDVWRQFGCRLLVHDYTGAGALRETFLIQAGLDADVVIPVAYIGAARQHTMTYKPATPERPRAYWQVDKTKSLGLTCACIKLGILRFFKYDFKSKDDPGLLHDFLSLTENKTPTAAGSDIYTIIRSPMFPDDFAQAVNIGCCALWQSTGRWPDLASARRYMANEQHSGADEPGADWRDGDAAIYG